MLNTKSCQFSTGHIPCGLVARIRRFHRRGRGSIPRKGANFWNKVWKQNEQFIPSMWDIKYKIAEKRGFDFF